MKDNYRQHIVDWLTQYLEGTTRWCFVVGVSGGVDSAVVSTLCAETGKSTLVVSLPCHTQPESLKLAQRHCDWLKKKYPNVSVLTLNISRVFDEFRSQVREQLGQAYLSELAFANTQSRLRMLSLYQIAQSQQGLVVGTGNRVEDFGVGFFTKWGDGGVDISPIGDLTKTQVWALARTLKILPAIRQAAPTDGLWQDGRTDEDQLGASYAELEWAMTHDLATTPREQTVLEIYQRHRTANLHKMTPIPVCELPRDSKKR